MFINKNYFCTIATFIIMSMCSYMLTSVLVYSPVYAADTLRIEAESYSSSSGGLALTPDGSGVTGTNSGKWSRYNNVDFGFGFQKLNVRFAQTGDSWFGQCIKVYVVDSGTNFDIANPPSKVTECFINRNTNGTFVEKAEMITIVSTDPKVQYYSPGLVDFANTTAVGVKDVIIAYTPGNANFDSGVIDWIEFSMPATSSSGTPSPPPTFNNPRIQAESYNEKFGDIIKTTFAGEAAITQTRDKTWARYNNFDFGFGYRTIKFKYSQYDDTWTNPSVTLYAVEPGAVFNATVPTGENLGTFALLVKSQTAYVITDALPLSVNTSGVKDIIAVFSNGGGQVFYHSGTIDWFEFNDPILIFQIRNIQFYNGSDSTVETLKNQTSVKATLSYINNYSEGKNICLLIALYKKNSNGISELIDTTYNFISPTSSSSQQTMEVQLTNLPDNINQSSNDYFVKAYSCSDIMMQIPLKEPVILN